MALSAEEQKVFDAAVAERDYYLSEHPELQEYQDDYNARLEVALAS